jgi:hypothetical protein
MKRYSQSLRRAVGVVAVLAAAGGAVAASSDVDKISFRVVRAQFNLTMSPQHVTGPEYQVDRVPNALRGRVAGTDVQLSLEDQKVKGTLGTLPVNLDVKKEGDVVTAKGGFWGRPVTVSYSPKELTIYVRDCTYRLKAKELGRSYEGRRSCDRAFTPPAEISLPDEFLTARPEEQVSLLLLAL